jgi:hypothetical protein
MEPKGNVEVRSLCAPDPHSLNKRQTSDEELEELRRRGRYVVLPPVEGPPEEVWEVLSKII